MSRFQMFALPLLGGYLIVAPPCATWGVFRPDFSARASDWSDCACSTMKGELLHVTTSLSIAGRWSRHTVRHPRWLARL
jgi:hypothetical protein